MVDSFGQPQDAEEAQAELKRKLVRRVAVAGLVAAILLATLAIIDQTTQSDNEPPVPIPVAVDVQAPPPPPVMQDNESAPAAPDAVAADISVEPTLAELPLSVEPTPDPAKGPFVAVPTSKPPTEATRTLRVLAERQAQVAVLPTTDTTAPPPLAAPEIQATPAVPESSARPEVPPPAPVVHAVPSQRRELAAEAEGTAPPVASRKRLSSAATRLSHGYIVQAGVFNDPQRAEQLHQRLVEAGVPATLETRVQVGPFASRQEAEAAQTKVRALGIESLLVAPRR